MCVCVCVETEGWESMYENNKNKNNDYKGIKTRTDRCSEYFCVKQNRK